MINSFHFTAYTSPYANCLYKPSDKSINDIPNFDILMYKYIKYYCNQYVLLVSYDFELQGKYIWVE